MAPQRVVPDEGGPAGLTAEGPLGHDLGHVVGAARMGPFPALRGPVLCFGLVPVHLVDVLGQAAGPLGVEAAEVALEGTVFAVDPAVHAQGGRTGAGVATLGTLLGVVGLVQPAVLQEVGPVPALEGAVQALEGVLDADVRLEVGLHGAAHVTVLALERLLPGVHDHVPFQVRADFELGATEPALEGGVPCVGAEVDGELAGVAAGVRAELAFVWSLIGMYPQVLLEAAAVHGGIVTQVTLVGLHAGVAPHMHGQVVLAAEALVTELTLVWFVSRVDS